MLRRLQSLRQLNKLRVAPLYKICSAFKYLQTAYGNSRANSAGINAALSRRLRGKFETILLSRADFGHQMMSSISSQISTTTSPVQLLTCPQLYACVSLLHHLRTGQSIRYTASTKPLFEDGSGFG